MKQVNWATPAQLIAALESGDWPKTTGILYRPEPTDAPIHKLQSAPGYCCLGVLCRISGLTDSEIDHYDTLIDMDSTALCYELVEGSNDEGEEDEVLAQNYSVPEWLDNALELELVSLNDKNPTFAQVIERLNLEVS